MFEPLYTFDVEYDNGATERFVEEVRANESRTGRGGGESESTACGVGGVDGALTRCESGGGDGARGDDLELRHWRW